MDCSRVDSGIPERMSEHFDQERDQEPEPSDNGLLEAQEDKGYGEDEGEREEALENE